MRVAVVGGGIVGLACAHALAERGMEVVLLEGASSVGGGASRGNTGWIVPSLSMPLAAPGALATGVRAALNPRGALVIRPALDSSWLRWLWQFRRSCSAENFRRGVSALLELNRLTFQQLDAYRADGIEFESHSTGVLVVALEEKGLAWFSMLFDELVRAGFDGVLRPLDGAQARELEPALSDAVACALHTSTDRHVQPQSLMAGLALRLERDGVLVSTQAAVVGLEPKGRGWQLRTQPAGTVEADRVVIAAGAATSALLAPLGVRLPLVGAKGYSVDLVGSGRTPRTALYLSEPKIGLSPFDDGLRIAGVFELPGRSVSVSTRRIEQIVADTVPFMSSWRPAPGELRGQGWAGLRPATPDGLPLLGALPGLPGVIVASGHGMLGVTLAPATAVVVADMLETGTTPSWVEAFRPTRRI
jgi:D-amino-acid dehydrogenase